MKRRLDRWKEPLYLDSGFTLGADADEALLTELADLRERRSRSAKWAESKRQTLSGLIRSCKEIVFDLEDDRYVFHFICCTVNAERIEVEVSHLMASVPDPDPEENRRQAIYTLALSRIEEVPIYPNTKSVEPELLRLYKEMLQAGFEAPDESGKPIRLILRKRHEISA